MKVNRSRITDILLKTELFGGLSDQSRQAVADVAMPREFAKKDMLFAEGTKGATIYVLIEGSIQLTKAAPDGREVPVRTIKPGETFAEVILFEREQYPVTATALTTSTTIGFLRDDIIRLLDDRTIRRDFITMLMKRQRYLLERLRALTTDDVEERLFRFLHDQHGAHPTIHLKISKKDVAAAIGTQPETLSRLIQRLKSQDILEWDGKTICIDPSFWKRFCGT